MHDKSFLDNGIRIVSEYLPGSRVVSVGIWIEVGSRDEHDLNNGCAHFVEHMLFKGTAGRTAARIAREFDALGGTANAFTTRESTCLYATVLDSHMSDLVGLLGDLLLHSVFANEEVDRERQVILQEIRGVEDMPEEQIHDLFAPLLWGEHPLGRTILGSPEVVAAQTGRKLADYVARYYTPSNIIIAAAGNVKHSRLHQLWQEIFKETPGVPRSVPRRGPPTSLPARQQVFPKALEQVHLLLGTYALESGSPGRYQLLLLNTLLGGNMSSRLFQEIREKRGLAYTIYSYPATFADSGYLAIYAAVDRTVVNDTLRRVNGIINSFCDTTVSTQELGNAREFAKAGLFLSMESMEAIMTRIARNELNFGRYVDLEEIVEAIDAVTPDDIRSLALRLFAGREMTVAALGPVAEAEVDWQPLN